MKDIWSNLKMFVWMSLLTGLIYPLIITGVAQMTMKKKADGDLLAVNGKMIGARLIAQKFESPRYFWPRPSAVDYNPLTSGGSNLGPTSGALKKVVEEREITVAKAQGISDKTTIPVELLFASGSGLDPHISLDAARFQLERVALARGLDENTRKELDKLIYNLSEGRYFGFLGEPCINVLKLNLALDEITLEKQAGKK